MIVGDRSGRLTCARLREQIALAISDADAARVLAAVRTMTHDVAEVRAELRAHTQVLNALRETQLTLQETQLELRKTQLEQGREIREGFAMQAAGMVQITALLTKIAGPGTS